MTEREMSERGREVREWGRAFRKRESKVSLISFSKLQFKSYFQSWSEKIGDSFQLMGTEEMQGVKGPPA